MMESQTFVAANKIFVVVKGIILHEGKVLIVKRSADEEIGRDSWETVGGKIEFGEDLETALIREINEETGLTVAVERILFATTFKTDPVRQVVILSYLCKSSTRQVVLSAEHSDYQWADADQLRSLLPKAILQDFEQNNVFAQLGI
jgi:8-oxo-dGTP diphosphatase